MDDRTIERFNEIPPATHNKGPFYLVVSEVL